MLRRIRRILLLAVVVGAVGAVLERRAAASRTRPAAPPRWPPIEVEPAAPVAAPATLVSEPDSEPAGPVVAESIAVASTWVLPVDGECPNGFPIKANDRSRIYHVPGGRSYERTVPQRCYENPEDAVADGYRAARA